MKAKLLAMLCVLVMSSAIQAQTTEFETATEAVKNISPDKNMQVPEKQHANIKITEIR